MFVVALLENMTNTTQPVSNIALYNFSLWRLELGLCVSSFTVFEISNRTTV